MTDLLAYIQTITDFSQPSWELLRQSLSIEVYAKGAYLLEAGQSCHSIFFISKGYCRLYQDKEGVEINTNFYFETDFATNIQSLVTNAKSTYAIQACEALKVIRFDKQQLLELYKHAPEIESFGRKLLEILLAKQQAHIDLFKLLSAGERYEYIRVHQATMLERVSLTQLSSYLGIRRETLSRIRSRK